VLAAAAALTLLPPVDELPLAGYAAIALLLVGTLMLMPRLAALLLRSLPAPPAAAAALALAQLRGAPARVGLSLATIVASVSLMVSMAIMVSSFRHSLDAWLARVLPADAYVRVSSGGDTGYIPPEIQSRIAALPGLARVEFQRERDLMLDPGRPPVALVARPVDPAMAAQRLPLVGEGVPVAAGAPPPLWASEAVADLYGFVPGAVVALPLAEAAVRFTVAGIIRDYARQQGAIVIDRDRYVAATGDTAVTHGALWLTPGATTEAMREAIAREIPGGERLDVFLPGEIRAVSLRIFDRTFAVTYALELAAVAIGLAGLSSTFGALVLARRREFGMLRHLGMTRRQVGAMLATEGLAVGAVGLVAGLGLGALMSLVLIHVVNRQSFHWGMELAVHWAALGGLAAILLALATVTAVASGRQAMGRDVVRAVKDDW
jgi:putative ABC transport system permease protein